MTQHLVHPQRQVHLDFHTSPLIPDVGCEFDASEFARTLKQAHVNSVTIFAKCHHGMSYYPTKVGTAHPALKGRDLTGEMFEALHREGFKLAMEKLIGAAPFGAALPTTVLSVPRRRGRDLLLTLLHYVPLRKALDIEVIEERMSFAGERLDLPSKTKTVRIFGSNESLPLEPDGSFTLPPTKGRLLLEVPGYFS